MFHFRWGFTALLLVTPAIADVPLLAIGQDSLVKTESNETKILLEEAKQYYDATLFDRAIPVLQKLLTTLHSNSEQKAWARLRLGQSYYFIGKYSDIPEVLSEVVSSSHNINPVIQSYNSEALFLLGLSYSKLGKHDQSVTTFLRYLSLEEQRLLPFHFDAIHQLGVAYFHLNKFEEAKQQFAEITPQTPQKMLYALSQIYLCRIAIAEKNYSKAERLLDSLSKEASVDDVFTFALAFLKGEIYFTQGDWATAIHYFQQATPKRNIRRADWAKDALFYMGWSYLNLSEEKFGDEQTLRESLSASEQAFKKLIEVSPSDRAYLGLGQCYLSMGMHLNDREALLELENLLCDKKKFSTRKALQHALLLRAEASPSYNERKKFFRQITSEANWDSPYYANAWYLRGLNEFDEGQELAISGRKQEAKKHLEHSLRALSRAFDLLYPTDKKLASLALKFQVQANFHLSTREGYLKGLAILGKILNQYRDDLFLELDDPGEIFFLQGLIAANLVEGDEGQTFFGIAENSLNHTIESFPKSEYYDESLRLLGTLYYSRKEFDKAEDTFLQLAHKSPPSPFAGEGLFWASNSSEMLNEDNAKTKLYRRKVFEQHPNSPFAAEAFFRYYSYSEYLKGNPQAIGHLTAFLDRYPNNPFVLNALYLLGLNHLQEKKSPDGKRRKKQDPEAAVAAFSQLETSFNSLYDNSLIPEEKTAYFVNIRYRALLERALALLTLAQESKKPNDLIHLQEAEKCLHQMYTDFDNYNHPVAGYLMRGESLAVLQEESAYQLATCYILEGDDEAAERLLGKMVEKYQNAKVTRGAYLSKVLYELGRISSRRKNYKFAIQHFKHAEDAAKGKVLRPDELLDLWIEQSYCYRQLGEMDEAMLILSRIINYDAVSPKRLKAMYLRALVYEEQGRQELARRQLEAVAKKGGKWSVKAKEKLEESYVYQ